MPSNISTGLNTEHIEIQTLSKTHLRARWFYLRLRISKRLPYRSITSDFTQRIGLNTHVKYYYRPDRIAEGPRTIQFVARHTTVPVPAIGRLYHILGPVEVEDESTVYMIMDQAPGQPLLKLGGKISEQTKCKIMHQLRGCIAQLRNLVAPDPELVASPSGGPLYEPARLNSAIPVGPFPNHYEFHSFLRVGDTLVTSHSLILQHFTHGDLAPRNIMCTPSGTVTRILDWETAGWYPEYRKYTEAHHAPKAPRCWIDNVGLITGEYKEQLVAERRLSKLV